ncbi:D-sedoheptulose 7-phosphate isomerase [bacterium]|nr:D-sedoheptulose 7-phosphate isomerase [bacterium]
MEDKIINEIQQSIEVKEKIKEQASIIADIVKLMVTCIREGGKILVCGNGGSAADAQHFVAEIIGRYMMERKAFPAIALTTDTSILTAVGNDYGFDAIFERQVEGLGKPGDVLIGISTSGNSENVIRAVKKADELSMYAISITGKCGGKLAGLTCYNFDVPSNDTPRIQEVHGMVLHIIAGLLEEELIKS